MDIVDHRKIISGCTFCKKDKDYFAQTLCMGFIENTRLAKCVFRKPKGICDITSQGYDNVIKFNEGRGNKK